MFTIEDFQHKRGTAAENDAYTGRDGTISIDVEGRNIRVHDGKTAGGFMRISILDTLSSTKGEFLVGEERKVAGEAVTDYETNSINLSVPARVRVYHNDIELTFGTEWRALAYDDETDVGAFRILVPMNAGDSVRIIQFVTVYDIVDEIFINRADDLRPDDYVELTQRAAPNGVATLDSKGKIPLSQLPSDDDLGYELTHVYTTADAIDLGDMDLPGTDPGTLDAAVPGDVLTVFDQIDLGEFGGSPVATIETPRLITPQDGTAGVNALDTFEAGGYFAQLANGDNDPQAATVWQFYNDAERTDVIYDSGRVIENFTTFTFSGTDAQMTAGQVVYMTLTFESTSGQTAKLDAVFTLASE